MLISLGTNINLDEIECQAKVNLDTEKDVSKLRGQKSNMVDIICPDSYLLQILLSMYIAVNRLFLMRFIVIYI